MGAALLVSACAHALAGATLGVVLKSISHPSASQPEVLDIELAPVVGAPTETAVSGAGSARPEPAPRPSLRRVVAGQKATEASAPPSAPPSTAMVASPPPEGDALPARFALGAVAVTTRPYATPTGSSSQRGTVTAPETDVASEREVNVPARLLSSSPLVYPPAARKEEIETDFPVEIVVDVDGHVSSARALSRAGYGLDEAALSAIRAYQFSPAIRAGQPVRVRMHWTVQFRLR